MEIKKLLDMRLRLDLSQIFADDGRNHPGIAFGKGNT